MKKLSRFLLLVTSLVAASDSSGFDKAADDDSLSTPSIAASQNHNNAVDDDKNSNDRASGQEDALNEKKKTVTLDACRRNPTWRNSALSETTGIVVDYDECRSLTGWTPRDFWWRVDENHAEFWLDDGVGEDIAECIDERFEQARQDGVWWAQCNEMVPEDENCRVPPTKVVGYYTHYDEDAHGDDNGDLVIVKNTFTEQEAYGLESLQQCMHKVLMPIYETPFYEERSFGDEDEGIYAGKGGNIVTFLTGFLQLYLPGVASSAYRAMTLAHEYAAWEDKMEIPDPNSLGMHNAEFLEYGQEGLLGTHSDTGSVMTISVALSNPDDYKGGYFRLFFDDALFKVPRRTGIVFLADSTHGITEIHDGHRKVFVTELWEDDDSPISRFPRQDKEDFDEYKADRLEALRQSGMDVLDGEDGRYDESLIDMKGEVS